MSTLIDELIELTEQIASLSNLPPIQEIILPPLPSTLPHFETATHSKYSKFGLLILQDGSAGFFYRLLDTAEWKKNYSDEMTTTILSKLQGSDPTELASSLRSPDPLYRALGMAAINAVSQYVFKKADFNPAAIQNRSSTTGRMITQPRTNADSRVGMVGYFSPMVAALQDESIPTTVIELDKSLYQDSESLVVTGDMSQLKHCNPIYCTASTLLNNSLEGILEALPSSTRFELVGPTCGCFADPFFKRGVDSMGSSRVIDTEQAVLNIRTLQPWGESVKKYAMSPENYPGFDALAERLKRA